VLESPSVAVKSGDTATVFSGAKVPFAVQGAAGQTSVQYEQVGVKLDVTPWARGGDVDLDIGIEVSALGEIATSGYQLIDTSTIRTSGYCRAGESVVIGGLERVSDRIEYNRVPEAGDAAVAPLLTLYRSKDYKKSKSRFLVFITPQVFASSSEANTEIRNQFDLLERPP
jgi:Flp pilus assembly secretin CpaC